MCIHIYRCTNYLRTCLYEVINGKQPNIMLYGICQILTFSILFQNYQVHQNCNVQSDTGNGKTCYACGTNWQPQGLGDSQLLKAAWSFVLNVRNQLEASSRNVLSVVMKKKYSKWPKIIRIKFIQQVQDNVNYNPSKSIRGITEQLKMMEFTLRYVVPQNIRYKFYIIRKRQLKIWENHD